MKKLSVKKQLVDFMIANGNDFRYTDMIKATLRICRGKNYVYDRKYDRGFYATNFSKGSNGYIVNGGGECGVYKNEHGRWSAKYYTKADKINYTLERRISILTSVISRARSIYDSDMRRISEIQTGEYKTMMFNEYFSKYRSIVDSSKADAQNKISKAILKLI